MFSFFNMLVCAMLICLQLESLRCDDFEVCRVPIYYFHVSGCSSSECFLF